MASTYSYTTLATIENLTGLDYSAINSTTFADAKVESIITIAERMVNGYLGVSTAQTVTDGIKVATILITVKLLAGRLMEMGYQKEAEHTTQLIDMSIKEILETFVDADVGIDAIPMSGANNAIYGVYGSFPSWW